MAQDPYRYFRIEAREIIDQLGTGVLELEKTGGDAELVARCCGRPHDQSAARIVKQREIADLAPIEDALARCAMRRVHRAVATTSWRSSIGWRSTLPSCHHRRTARRRHVAPAKAATDDVRSYRAPIPRHRRADRPLAEIHAQINRLRTTTSLDALVHASTDSIASSPGRSTPIGCG